MADFAPELIRILRAAGCYFDRSGKGDHQIWFSPPYDAVGPDPVPVLVLARLAIDRRAQGRHLGAALLRDAVSRAMVVSQNAGVRALLVHALHEKARQFYEHYGFTPSPLHPLTLMLRSSHAKA